MVLCVGDLHPIPGFSPRKHRAPHPCIVTTNQEAKITKCMDGEAGGGGSTLNLGSKGQNTTGKLMEQGEPGLCGTGLKWVPLAEELG